MVHSAPAWVSTLRRIAWWCFLAESLAAAGLSAGFFPRDWPLHWWSFGPYPTFWYPIFACAGLMATGVWAGLARPAGLVYAVAAMASLLVPPWGTLAGLAGLAYCAAVRAYGQAPEPDERNLSGWTTAALYLVSAWVVRRLAPAWILPGAAKGGLEILAALVALYAAITVHELGHLTAGLICGFRFHRLELPFFSIGRGGVAFSDRMPAGALGLCAMDPSRECRSWQLVFYTAGGLIANVAMMLACLWLARRLAPDSVLFLAAVDGAAMGPVFLWLNWNSSSGDRFESDGGSLRRLGDERYRRMVVAEAHCWTSLELAEGAPRDWPAERIALFEGADVFDRHAVGVFSLLCLHYEDRNQHEGLIRAAERLRLAYFSKPAESRPLGADLNVLWYAGRYLRDEQTVRELHQAGRGGWYGLLADAVHADVTGGDPLRAIELVDQALADPAAGEDTANRKAELRATLRFREEMLGRVRADAA